MCQDNNKSSNEMLHNIAKQYYLSIIIAAIPYIRVGIKPNQAK